MAQHQQLVEIISSIRHILSITTTKNPKMNLDASQLKNFAFILRSHPQLLKLGPDVVTEF